MPRLVPAGYRPVLGNRVFRRLLLGFGVSYLGDGLSFVAVAWLAIELAPQPTAGLWVGGAVAAYTLPGVVGALLFGRRLRREPARRLLLADNIVRGVFLGAVPLAWFAGLLTLPLYVALLAVSSLLHAWGSAGKYTLLAELLPDEQRLAANTLVSSLNFTATIAGPAIAGVLVTYASAAIVLGLDALTYAFLAVLVARLRLPGSGPASPVDRSAARGGFALLRRHPELLGLLALTWFFNLLYGPVEVALPLHVTDDLRAPGTLLGLYWMLFGIGAVLGGLAVGALRRLPLWPVTVGIVVAWGLALLPFGFGAPAAVTVACFALGGAIYGPFVALSVTLMQAKSPPRQLAAMLAARSAALLTAAPLGTALGGPLSTALGPRATLGGSGAATVLLGAVAGILLLARRRKRGKVEVGVPVRSGIEKRTLPAVHSVVGTGGTGRHPVNEGVPMTDGIKTLIYPVSDLAAAKTTFAQLLGVEPYADQPYYVGFKVNGQDIGLDPNGHRSGMTGPVAYLHVEDIEKSVQVLLAAGGEIQGKVRDVGGGRLIVTVKDADGNAIGLLQEA